MTTHEGQADTGLSPCSGSYNEDIAAVWASVASAQHDEYEILCCFWMGEDVEAIGCDDVMADDPARWRELDPGRGQLSAPAA